WRFFENYFDIPGLVAFARILDHLRETGASENKTTYEDVWADVHASLYEMYIFNHFKEDRGGYFPAIKQETGSYIEMASKEIKEWLKKLRQQNRKVFLMTSSNVDFAYFIMDFIFGKDWPSLFDLRLFQAKKPSFFTESRAFLRTSKEFEIGEPVEELQPNGDYSQGNKEVLMKFFRKETGKADPKHSSLVTAEELRWMVSDFWGSIFIDDLQGDRSAEELRWMVSDFWGSIFIDDLQGDRSETADKNLKMNTAYGDLISQYATICVPSIEYLAGVPVDHNFAKFSKDAGNARGFHPGRPVSLLVSQ
ncbi:5'-nucleotidase domain-containing protein 1, partial [Elysia marginata]